MATVQARVPAAEETCRRVLSTLDTDPAGGKKVNPGHWAPQKQELREAQTVEWSLIWGRVGMCVDGSPGCSRRESPGEITFRSSQRPCMQKPVLYNAALHLTARQPRRGAELRRAQGMPWVKYYPWTTPVGSIG